jgi:hypothetical protein
MISFIDTMPTQKCNEYFGHGLARKDRSEMISVGVLLEKPTYKSFSFGNRKSDFDDFCVP